MSIETGAVLRTSRRALAQQARRRALDLARDEGLRVGEGVQHAAVALAAIRGRAHARSSESARVRALGLECLPDHRYLAHCTERLRAELSASRFRRTWLSDVRSWAGEVEALLVAAIDLTSTIDIAGELDLSLDLVVAVQTGARAGLSALRRLYDDLYAVETGQLAAGAAATAEAGPRALAGSPSRPAQWLAQLASRLLPVSSRDRYLEEFSGELRELADAEAGSRAQLAYSLRLISRAWSLRNALPPDLTRAAIGADRVRVAVRADSTAGRAPARPAWRLRRVLTGWKARRDTRATMRRLVRQRKALSQRGRPDTAVHAYRRRSGERSPIVVNHRAETRRRRYGGRRVIMRTG